MDTILIDGVPIEVIQLESFAFYLKSSNAEQPLCSKLAMIRVDRKGGVPLLVKGSEAVTLKVQLASIGLKDLSHDWHPVCTHQDEVDSVLVLNPRVAAPVVKPPRDRVEAYHGPAETVAISG